MRQFARFAHACVKGLPGLAPAVSPRTIEHTPATLCEGHKRGLATPYEVRRGAHEALSTEPLDVLAMHVRSVLRTTQFVHGHDAEGAGRCEDAHLGAAQFAFPVARPHVLARTPSWQAQLSRQRVSRLGTLDSALGIRPTPATAGHLRPIPFDLAGIHVSMHTTTPSLIQMRPEVVEGGV